MKVKFVPQNVEFEIKPNESVMHVAQDHGIYIKSVCKGVPSCAECRVRLVEGEHNVLPPGSEELSLIGTGHFIDRRRLSCQLKCFGDITVDMTEQIAKEQGLIVGRKKKMAIKDDRVEQAVVRRSEESPDLSDESNEVTDPGVDREARKDREPRGESRGENRGERGPRNDRGGGGDRGNRNPNQQQARGGGGGGQNQNRQQNQQQSQRPQGQQQNRGPRPEGGRPEGPRAEGQNQQNRPPQGPRPEGQPRPPQNAQGAQGQQGQPGEPREGGGKRRRRRRGKGGGQAGGQNGGQAGGPPTPPTSNN